MMGSWPLGFGILGLLFTVLFWGAIIWLIVWLVTKYNPKKTESAIEILKKRFAKGEITKKQFEGMKKELSK